MEYTVRGHRGFGKRLGLLAVATAALFLLAASPTQAAPEPRSTTSGASLECAGPCPMLIFKKGNGTGRITSRPPGIDCGTFCDATIDDVDGIWLTPTASPGSRLDR
jgi:hypothetical protein